MDKLEIFILEGWASKNLSKTCGVGTKICFIIVLKEIFCSVVREILDFLEDRGREVPETFLGVCFFVVTIQPDGVRQIRSVALVCRVVIT